jgi:acyl carrier protein
MSGAVTSIEDQVRAHIETELMPGRRIELQADTSLVGIVDSTGLLELAMWVENTFGFSVEIDEITPEDFGTVQRLADWIRRGVDRAKG